MDKRAILLLLISLFLKSVLLISQVERDEKKLALVIGNSLYGNDNLLLNQPVNDASDITSVLKQMKFDVILITNGTQQKMDEKISEFGNLTNQYKILLFFYSGYSVQYKGENFLIPTDANITAESDIKYRCTPVNQIISKMSESGSTVNIVILDASHENPFEKKWSRSVSSSGMSKTSSPVGTIISYASAPGTTIPVTPGRNGLYTSTLLKYIKTPRLEIIDLFTNVRKEVYLLSSKKQITWESNSLMEEYYLNE